MNVATQAFLLIMFGGSFISRSGYLLADRKWFMAIITGLGGAAALYQGWVYFNTLLAGCS